MRFPRIIFLLGLTLLLSATLMAQQVPRRDPQAVAILHQSLAAMGASNVQNIADTRSEVTIRSNEDGQVIERTAVWKTLGHKAWRVETQGPDGSGVFIANDDWAVSRSGSEQEEFPSVAVGDAGNWRIPFLSILADVDDPGVAVELVEAGEAKLLHIRLRPRPKKIGLTEVMEPCDVFMDPQTFLPVRLRFSLHPSVNLLVDIPAEVEYRDYKFISGLLIPTQLRYSVRSRLVNEIFLKSFAPNVGLSPTDFAVR